MIYICYSLEFHIEILFKSVERVIAAIISPTPEFEQKVPFSTNR